MNEGSDHVPLHMIEDMKQTASEWVILTRKLVAGFHPQNDKEN